MACIQQFVTEMVNTWLQINSVVTEDKLWIQWKCYWREEAKALEQQSRVKCFEASQVQILD